MNFDERYKDEISEYRDKVNEQASEKGGWINLTSRETGEVKAIVAKHPFYRWALNSSSIDLDKLYPWDNVCPHSFKLDNDSVDHSDWMVGAGCSFEEYHNDEENTDSIGRMSYRAKRRIQRKELNFEKMVLCNGGVVTGRIKHVKSLKHYHEQIKEDKSVKSTNNWSSVQDGDIIVIPHAGVDFELAFLAATKSGAGGVITLIPNKVAHLYKIARERDVTVMCDPDAFDVYNDGWCKVTLNPHRGTIEVESN